MAVVVAADDLLVPLHACVVWVRVEGASSLTSIISFLHFLPTLTSMTSFTVALEFLALLIHLTPFLDVIDFLPRLPCWNPIFPSYLEILPLRFILT